MTTLLCINPKSRSGQADYQPYVDTLQKLGPVEVIDLTDENRQLSDVLNFLSSSLSRIVVGGGDGTLNSVLQEICTAGVPVGVLPLGTANDFARSLGLSPVVSEALNVIVEGHMRKVDMAEANGRLFVNAAGIGLGPELTRLMDQEKKQKLGVLAYLFSFLEVMGLNRRRYASIYLDGKRVRKRFMQITIANGVHYGGGLTIAQEARLDDGLLKLLCIYPQSIWKLLGKIVTLRWGVARGEYKKPGMRVYTAKRVVITTWRPIDVSIDGELVSQTPLTCTVIPKALDVYCAPDRDNRI